jgi:hypothetical protein
MLWGGSNIQKKRIVCQGNSSKEYEDKICFWVGPFQEGFGVFSGERWRGALSIVEGGSTGVFEAQSAAPVSSAHDSPSFLTTEGMHAKIVQVMIKVIVIHGVLGFNDFD